MADRRLPVDAVFSLAHREGATVRVQLHLPDADLPAGTLEVILERGSEHRREEGELRHTDHGAMLRFTVGPEAPGRRPWRVAVRHDADETVRPLLVRLLVRPGQPVALLPGPAPRTRLEPPRRRPAPQVSPTRKAARRGRSLARRVRDSISSRR